MSHHQYNQRRVVPAFVDGSAAEGPEISSDLPDLYRPQSSYPANSPFQPDYRRQVADGEAPVHRPTDELLNPSYPLSNSSAWTQEQEPGECIDNPPQTFPPHQTQPNPFGFAPAITSPSTFSADELAMMNDMNPVHDSFIPTAYPSSTNHVQLLQPISPPSADDYRERASTSRVTDLPHGILSSHNSQSTLPQWSKFPAIPGPSTIGSNSHNTVEWIKEYSHHPQETSAQQSYEPTAYPFQSCQDISLPSLKRSMGQASTNHLTNASHSVSVRQAQQLTMYHLHGSQPDLTILPQDSKTDVALAREKYQHHNLPQVVRNSALPPRPEKNRKRPSPAEPSTVHQNFQERREKHNADEVRLSVREGKRRAMRSQNRSSKPLSRSKDSKQRSRSKPSESLLHAVSTRGESDIGTIAAYIHWKSRFESKMPTDRQISRFCHLYGGSFNAVRNWWMENSRSIPDDEDTGYQTATTSASNWISSRVCTENQYVDNFAENAYYIWMTTHDLQRPTNHQIESFCELYGGTLRDVGDWWNNITSNYPDVKGTDYDSEAKSDFDRIAFYKRNVRDCRQKPKVTTSLPKDGARPYVCGRCGSTFSKRAAWKRHEEIRSPRKLWLCRLGSCLDKPESKRVFRRTDKFTEHLKRIHKNTYSAEDLERCTLTFHDDFIDQENDEEQGGAASESSDSDSSLDTDNDSDSSGPKSDDDKDHDGDALHHPNQGDGTGAAPHGHDLSQSRHQRGQGSQGRHPGSAANTSSQYQYDISSHSPDSPGSTGFVTCGQKSTLLLTTCAPDDPSKITNKHSFRSWPLTYSKLGSLGQGPRAIVDEVRIEGYKSSVARKVIYDTSFHTQQKAHREATIMASLRSLKHPHTTHLIASYEESSSMILLMQPVAECNLLQYLSACSEQPPSKEMWNWFSCLSSGLSQIHGLGILHRDIKPSNILVKNGGVLYSDFGSSSFVADDESVITDSADFTEQYAAPEVYEGKRGRAADVFALGCVFLEMATVLQRRSLKDLRRRKRADHDRSRLFTVKPKAQDWAIDWTNDLRLEAAKTPPLPYLTQILDSCKAMMRQRPEHRPSATKITQHIAPPRSYSERPDLRHEKSKSDSYGSCIQVDENNLHEVSPAASDLEDSGSSNIISCKNGDMVMRSTPRLPGTIASAIGNSYSNVPHSAMMERFLHEHDRYLSFLTSDDERDGPVRPIAVNESCSTDISILRDGDVLCSNEYARGYAGDAQSTHHSQFMQLDKPQSHQYYRRLTSTEDPESSGKTVSTGLYDGRHTSSGLLSLLTSTKLTLARHPSALVMLTGLCPTRIRIEHSATSAIRPSSARLTSSAINSNTSQGLHTDVYSQVVSSAVTGRTN